MKNVFDYQGRLINTCRTIMYVVAGNLLFLLCSLPVITAGASLTALYTLLFRYQQGQEPPILATFFGAFRDNFKKATLLWGLMLLVLASLGMNYTFFYLHQGGDSTGIRVLMNLVLVLWAVTGIYLFPSLAFFENSCRGYLIFSLALAFHRLPNTLLLLGVWGGMLWLLLLLAQYLSAAILLLLLLGFALPANFTARRLLHQFQTSQQGER